MAHFFKSLAADCKSLATAEAWGLSGSELVSMLPQGALNPTMGFTSLTCVGVGLMLGAGIFVSPGYIAAELTGPALFVAYLIAAVSAYLSSFCYAEFAVSMPLAGAAYNYIVSALGEFIAWVVTSNLILEYVLANAAAARGFAPYFAVLIGQQPDYFLYTWTGPDGEDYLLDWWAFSISMACTVLLCWGVRESANVNTAITIGHILVMVFIIIAGLTKADKSNFTPFFPNEQPDQWKQVFNGAAIAFFSYIGFDAVATAAEEVKNPGKLMPLGIISSVSIVTLIYTMMCVTLNLMVPRDQIDEGATFASAFAYVGMDWAKHVVAVGACLGIITGVLMGIYACARILTGCSRERMLPPFIAMVGQKQTPWVATWIIGTCTAVIALMTPFAELANMISIGTFVVFWFVAIALIWRRHFVPGQTGVKNTLLLLLHILAIIGFSLGFTLIWTLPVYQPAVMGVDYGTGEEVVVQAAGDWQGQQNNWLIALIVLTLVTPVSLYFTVPMAYVPIGYKVPLYPLLPCASVFVNTFLLGQLDQKSYKRFGWWTLAVLGIYLTYSVFASQAKDNRRAAANSSCDPSSKSDPECPPTIEVVGVVKLKGEPVSVSDDSSTVGTKASDDSATTK